MPAWEVPTLIAWMRKVGPKIDAFGLFELLEISPTDDVQRIRDAYYEIAATRHPDLFRGRLGTAETELLMHVFGRVSNAYALLRDPEERKKAGAKPKIGTPPSGTPVAAPRKIAPRAMSHVRRADAALDSGDVASAILHLRMAVAVHPASKELRVLLADTEAKLKK